MKKSELIEILTLAYVNLPANSSPRRVAKEMLRVVEKHGMMPPETWIPGLPEIEGNKCLLMWNEEK